MQFSDAPGKSGIIQDITFFTGVDLQAYNIYDRTRNVNERFKRVWTIIFEAYNGWKFMDDNYTDASTGLPYADQNVTSGTDLYTLPSGSLVIEMVEIKTSSGSQFQRVYPWSHEDFKRAGGDAVFGSSVTGVPLHYLLQGDILRLLPIPNFTVTDGLRVYFNKSISTFSTSDTTKTPGFSVDFHRMLSIGASLDYAIARGLTEKKRELQDLWDYYEEGLRSFYSKRFADREPKRINPGSPDLVEEYL